MTDANDEFQLRHMLDAARKAQRFCASKNRTDLDRDEVLSLALIRLLEIVGEAASKVSQPVRDQHPDVPWQMMIGMRNRLIHAYDQIDLDILWQTIDQDLQPLIDWLEKLIGNHESDSSETD